MIYIMVTDKKGCKYIYRGHKRSIKFHWIILTNKIKKNKVEVIEK